jgi:hypothetical protein
MEFNENNYKIGIFMWYNEQIIQYAENNYKINKIYCEKYGYNLIKSNLRLCNERKPHWERIPLLLKYFNDFDYLIWIDADAHFYIDSPPITNVINTYPDKLFIFSGDTDTYHTNNNWVINSGFFIVKKCDKSKDILNIWLNNNELYKSQELSKPIFGSNNWNDQAVLRLMYSKNIENITDNSIIITYGILQHFNEDYKLAKKVFGLINRPFIFHSTNGENMIFKNRVNNTIKYVEKYTSDKYGKFINPNIQISKFVINDIVLEADNQHKKMLVFGLGHDSELWYNLTNKNTYFVEDNKYYIDLNKNINKNNIIFYEYKDINVENSFKLSQHQIQNFKIPEKLLELGPFDIILIDGPNGSHSKSPGRLLPIYWSTNYLSHNKTIIYIDDATRNLERKCINTYFINNTKQIFNDRLGTIKINI